MWQKGDPAGELGIISRRARLCSIIIHEEEVAGRLLLHVHLRVLLVDARAVVLGVAAERDVQELEEAVHAREQTLRRVCRGLDTGPAIVDDDTIGEFLPLTADAQRDASTSCMCKVRAGLTDTVLSHACMP